MVKRKLSIGLVMILFLIISIQIFAQPEGKNFFSILTSREKIEKVILSMGNWGPLFYIILYILVTITMISPLPVALVGGIIFGPVMGLVYTMAGAGLGLTLSFVIARHLARKKLEEKFGETEIMKKIDSGVEKDGWLILATTRLLPIFPFGIQNYVYGLTSIGLMQYVVLSIIFILPGTSVFVMLAGAFTSGNREMVVKYSLIASLVFFSLAIITKYLKKRARIEN